MTIRREDKVMSIHAQVQHLRKVRMEIDLAIKSLQGMLPEKKVRKKEKFRLLNPFTSKIEEY